MRNNFAYPLALTLFVLFSLLLMNELPPITLFGHTLRQVDILSDIRRTPPSDTDTDTLAIAPPIVKPAFVDTCPAGKTCIVDYSDSTLRGMTPFYQAIDRIGTLKRPVRVAVFGDSFIEGDILTADLREMLQTHYGGCGAGYIDITSSVSGFRPTVRHTFSGWQSHAATDSIGFNRAKQGPAGRYFIPSAGARVDLKGQSQYASHLDTCTRATIYFTNKGTLNLTARVNGTQEKTEVFIDSPRMQMMTVQGRIGAVRWVVNRVDSALFYGVAMEGEGGITVDNYSLRSSTGASLRHIPAETLTEFNGLRPYDLIVLQYGLNVATRLGRDYDYYEQTMLETIHHLKTAFPAAGILLIGVGDRDYKTDDGTLRTMPGVKNLIRYQENIAARSGIAFWNMFEAMGGEGSMAQLVHARPSKANYDYTHINFRGGRHLAGLLYDALIHGKQQYDRRRAYENR